MSEVIKVTSKGQITIPTKIRKKLNIEKDTYLEVDTIGDYVVMKKVGLKLKEINNIFQKNGKDKGITENEIESIILEVRKEVWA